MNRRRFVQRSSYVAAMGFLNTLPVSALLRPEDEVFHLTLLHTNDVHSRVDPFPEDETRNAGKGGVSRRKVIIDQVRAEGQKTLLIDAGDIFQGTPYFNLYKGELEMKLMSELGYDIGTIGNHDFDAGTDNLATQMKHANFPLVISNYVIDDTPLGGKMKDVYIWDFGQVKIGLYALGIELDGLVPEALYGNTRYLDPIKTAQKYEEHLAEQLDCDYVICLSHLGFKYDGSKVSDVVIAKETKHTDLIIGGHTHTFMYEPHIEKNKLGRPIMINQVGFAGILLGRIDLFFEKGSKRKAQAGTSLNVMST